MISEPYFHAFHQAKAAEEESADPAVVAELQREVEDLKLRLHMAAEHYKEKYKECQRLQKQVLRISEQQGVCPTGQDITFCAYSQQAREQKCNYVSVPGVSKWPLKVKSGLGHLLYYIKQLFT